MNKWKRGNIGRFWDPNVFKNLNYKKSKDPDINGKVLNDNSYGWMYDNSNPMSDCINNFYGLFGLKNQTYTLYKMKPGEIIPNHADHYRKYIKLFNVDYNKVCRVIVMLENWKSGHYLEIDGIGIVNWVAGDWFMWEGDTVHSAANIGVEDKYTLQITGNLSDNSFDTWARLYTYNIPGLPIETSNFIINKLLDRIPKIEKEKPLYIYGYNQRIKDLEKIKHNKETVEYLNKVGIHIYLYEPLCIYSTVSSMRHWGFYGEYSHTQNKFLAADELDSIIEYSNNNGLNNITVHTGDYNSDIVYGSKYSPLKLICDDLFLKIPPLFPKFKKVKNFDAFNKKFISLTWRYTLHRHIITAYLAMTNSANISWYYKSDLAVFFDSNIWFNTQIMKEKYPDQYQNLISGITALNNNAPYILDCDIKEATLVPDEYPKTVFPDVHSNHPLDSQSKIKIESIEKFYNDSFVDIVLESRFAQPTGNFSEKTYQPMHFMKPFVLVAPPYTLKYLKEQGFKTFSEFWDESYDEEEDHNKRIFKIFEVIDYIDSIDIRELKNMYNEMFNILKHNNNLYKEKIKPL